MLDTLKSLFSSIYRCSVVAALMPGSFWRLFAYRTMGLLYPCLIASVCALVLNRRERNRERAIAKADLQISPERQEEAIDEYVALINKNSKKKTENKVSQ